MVNKNYLYLKSWENNGISQVRYILNENGEFLTHEELKQKYNITTTFLQNIQVQKSIIINNVVHLDARNLYTHILGSTLLSEIILQMKIVFYL